MERRFQINNNKEGNQTIQGNIPLGHLLQRPEIKEYISKMGSTARTRPGEMSVEIVPPLTTPEQQSLAEFIVEVALSLDPENPPTYEIN
ncbi:hypothetical protein KW792_00960 [Candidatus Saccharibacteria bacterium]|nr:hypothetical protein [Candidatus Saccharibacteria bacterium]